MGVPARIQGCGNVCLCVWGCISARTWVCNVHCAFGGGSTCIRGCTVWCMHSGRGVCLGVCEACKPWVCSMHLCGCEFMPADVRCMHLGVCSESVSAIRGAVFACAVHALGGVQCMCAIRAAVFVSVRCMHLGVCSVCVP